MATLTLQQRLAQYATSADLTWTAASATTANADDFVSGGREILLVRSATAGDTVTINNPDSNCVDAVHTVTAANGVIAISPFPTSWRVDGKIQLTASSTAVEYALISCASNTDCGC